VARAVALHRGSIWRDPNCGARARKAKPGAEGALPLVANHGATLRQKDRGAAEPDCVISVIFPYFPFVYLLEPLAMSTELQLTPLAETHLAHGARMVDFGGWSMPLAYGSQIEEHHAVRRDAGMFDVSHMLNVDVTGTDAMVFLRRLVANDVARLTVAGKALYTCMLWVNGRLTTIYKASIKAKKRSRKRKREGKRKAEKRERERKRKSTP